MLDEIKWSMTINGQQDPKDYRMIAALINGGINDVPVGWLEFAARDKKLDLGAMVGTEMGFWVTDENAKKQQFWGTCISAEAKAASAGQGHYIVEIRPWIWFLTLSENNRIFQNKKTTDIIKEVLGEYGFSGDLKVSHSGTDPEREYCVQFRETDLNFINRLLEEEGFYSYFEYDDGSVQMVLADQPSTHGSAGEDDKYLYSDEMSGGAREIITNWDTIERAVTGKVTLRDFDFTKPSSDLTATSARPSGSHGHKSYENYRYPGRYADVSDGERRAAAQVEESAAGHKTWYAIGTMLNLHPGKIFEIVDHPNHEKAADNGFMVTRMAQYIQIGLETVEANAPLLRDPAVIRDFGTGVLTSLVDAFEDGGGHFQTVFESVLKTKPFRVLTGAKRPEMTGVQTATVTGAGGDEIMVDSYGRIKVQFHWDRHGKKDDKTTCWIRTMMPWTGKNWGMVALPRVGQEVVIQFVDGDPDRPLCVGMLYNAETMPPYDLPADATRSGVKTNSSKGGGGYNELMFEDKKGDELVRFMAEKDYVQNVQNQSHIMVGYDHPTDVRAAEAQADKSMKLEVKEHLDEIVQSGNHSFSVLSGQQTILIERDKDETINKNATLTVKDDMTTTISKGNKAETVEKGDKSTKVEKGNITVDAELGKIDITAMKSITLTCGKSSVKLDPKGITIKGGMVSTEGDMSLSAKAPMAEVKASGVLTLKGTLTKIN